MESVATAAGVTRVTAYNQFGSRAALVEAVLDEVVSRDRMDELVTGTSDLDPAAAVQTAIDRTCAFWAHEQALLRRLFATAYQERAIDEMIQRREGWRRAQWASLLARFGLPSDSVITRDGAADVLTALTSFPAYDRLGAAQQGPAAAASLLGHLALRLIRTP